VSDPAAPASPVAEGGPDRLFAVLEQLPAVVGVFRGPSHVVEFANPLYRRMAGDVPMLGVPIAELFDDPENRAFVDQLDRVFETGETFHGDGWRGIVAGEEVFYDFTYVPLRDTSGEGDGILVFAVDVTRRVGAQRALEVSDVRFRALIDADVVGVVVADAERIAEANDAFLTMAGHTRDELEAGDVSWRRMTPPEWAIGDEHALAELATSGRFGAYEKEIARPDGRRVPVLLAGAAFEQDPLRIVAFYLDLTERRRGERERDILLAREREARREAELAAGRMARLQKITAALSAAISADEVAQLVVEQAVEALGAAAGVVVLRDGEELELRRHVGYESAVTEPWGRFGVDAPVPLAEAVRSGEIVTVESVEAWEARYSASVAGVRQFEALAAVPFLFHGESLGAMGVSFSRPHAFTAEDRSFMLALGRQCGQALERARLYEERAYVARTLQEGLLPDELATVPGAEVAVRYHSISDGGKVGGDFYDLFDVAEDRWLLAIGDVCGKGTAAAVLTGLARHTIRAIAMRDAAPQDVLGFLNEAMRRQVVEGSYCTVGCATITPREHGGFSACLASGGHLNPLLIRPGEPVREVEVPGTLLGFVPHLELEPVAFDLEPGDALVFYTDGITDARDEGERFGDERLWAALEEARRGSADDIAEAVDEAVRRHQPHSPKDDRAVMVLKVADAHCDGS